MPILELENVSKHFGAIHALNDISLSLEPGEVVGLMGDNGAGKSTLVKIIAGNFRPSHGTMRMDGRELVMHRPVEARRGAWHRDRSIRISRFAIICPQRQMSSSAGKCERVSVRSRSSTMPRCTSGRCEIFAELKSETRPRDLAQIDVRRPAAGGGHRADATIGAQDRAHGRARRRRFRCGRSPRCWP